MGDPVDLVKEREENNQFGYSWSLQVTCIKNIWTIQDTLGSSQGDPSWLTKSLIKIKTDKFHWFISDAN